MLIAKHTIQTTASPSAVWEVWRDVENWKTWDSGVEYSFIDGPFETGTTGRLKPKGGLAVQMTLTQVEKERLFVDEAKLPLGQIVVSHHLTHNEANLVVTHQIEIKGPLTFVYAYLIGKEIKKTLPQAMNAMITRAQGIHGQVE